MHTAVSNHLASSQKFNQRLSIKGDGSAPYLREPVTVPPRELIVSYQALAARYREMAATESRSFAREGLLDLARQFEAAVGALEEPY